MNNSEGEAPVFERNEEKKVFDLLDLGEKDEQELKDEIEKHEGLVRIFVHPITEPENGKPISNQERVNQVLVGTLLSEKSPPIIILEESQNLNSWGVVSKEEDFPNTIYLVETIHDYPYPIIKGELNTTKKDEKGRLREEDFDYVEKGFKNFLEVLKRLGVKKMLVGGTSLVLLDGHITRCVGNFIRFMRSYGEGIEVKLSLGTAPLNRSDLRDIEPDLI